MALSGSKKYQSLPEGFTGYVKRLKKLANGQRQMFSLSL